MISFRGLRADQTIDYVVRRGCIQIQFGCLIQQPVLFVLPDPFKKQTGDGRAPSVVYIEHPLRIEFGNFDQLSRANPDGRLEYKGLLCFYFIKSDNTRPELMAAKRVEATCRPVVTANFYSIDDTLFPPISPP